jgi:hypothetical protein
MAIRLKPGSSTGMMPHFISIIVGEIFWSTMKVQGDWNGVRIQVKLKLTLTAQSMDSRSSSSALPMGVQSLKRWFERALTLRASLKNPV